MKETKEDDGVRLHLFESLQHKFGEGQTTSTSTTNLSVSGNGHTGTFSQVTTFSFNQTTTSPSVAPKSDLNTLLTNYMTQVPLITAVGGSGTSMSPNYNFLNPNDPVLLNTLRRSPTRATTERPQNSPAAVYSSPSSSAPSTPRIASQTVSHAGFDFGDFFASQNPATPAVEARTAGKNSTTAINSNFQATINNLLNDSTNTTLTSILTGPVTSSPSQVLEAASDSNNDTSAPMTL